MRHKYEEILTHLYKVNSSLRNPYNGLYVASVGEKYRNYVWIRDNYFQARATLYSEPHAYEQTYHSLLDYYKGLNYKYENKIDHLIKKPFPLNNIRFIHPRFFTNLTEITGDWGNLQIDSFGYFFLGIAEGIKCGLNIIRDDSDIEIINKLLQVLLKIKYWMVADNGHWEETEEIHASSIGAVLGGITALEEVEFTIPRKLFTEGFKKLQELLPNESITKHVDLAQLPLIWPFNIIDKEASDVILSNVHRYLEKENGVIRYMNDTYYGNSNEAEWTMGFAFLFLIYINTDIQKAEFYLNKMIGMLDENFYIPELFYGKTKTPNDNNPLGWSVGMLIVSIETYLKKMKPFESYL